MYATTPTWLNGETTLRPRRISNRLYKYVEDKQNYFSAEVDVKYSEKMTKEKRKTTRYILWCETW